MKEWRGKLEEFRRNSITNDKKKKNRLKALIETDDFKNIILESNKPKEEKEIKQPSPPEPTHPEKDTVEMNLEELDQIIHQREKTQHFKRSIRRASLSVKDIINPISSIKVSKGSILQPEAGVDNTAPQLSLVTHDHILKEKNAMEAFDIGESPFLMGSYVDLDIDNSSCDFSFESDKSYYNNEFITERRKALEKQNLEFGEKIRPEIQKIQEEYLETDEMLKQAKGKLLLDFESFDRLWAGKESSAFRRLILNPKLYKKLSSNLGKPLVLQADFTGRNIFIGTDHGRAVIFNTRSNEKSDKRLSSSDSIPSSIFVSEIRKTVIFGSRDGNLEFFGYSNSSKNYPEMKRLFNVKIPSEEEIAEIFPLNRENSVILIVDSSSKVFCMINLGNRWDKLKIKFTEVLYLVRDTLPKAAWDFEQNLMVLSHGRKISMLRWREDNPEFPVEHFRDLECPDTELECGESFPLIGKIKIGNKTKNFLVISFGYFLVVYELGDSLQPVPIVFLDSAVKIEIAWVFSNKYVMFQDDNAKILKFNINKIYKEKITKENSKKRKTLENIFPSDSTEDNSLTDHSLRQRSRSMFSTSSSLPNEELIQAKRRRRLATYIEEINSEFIFEDFILWKSGSHHRQTRAKLINFQNSKIFYLTKNGLSLFELMDYNTYIQFLIEKENYIYCLKIINDLLDGKETVLAGITSQNNLRRDLLPQLQSLVVKVVNRLSSFDPESQKLLFTYMMFSLAKGGLFDFMTGPLELSMTFTGFKDEYYLQLKIFYESQILPFISLEKKNEILKILESEPLKRQQFLFFVFQRRQNSELVLNECLKSDYQDLLVHLVAVHEPPSILLPIALFQTKFARTTDIPLKKKMMLKIFWFLDKVQKHIERPEGALGRRSYLWTSFSWFFEMGNIKYFFKWSFFTYLEGIYYLLANGLSSRLRRLDSGLGKQDLGALAPKGILKKESNEYLKDFFEKVFYVVEQESGADVEWNKALFSVFLAFCFQGQFEGLFISEKYLRWSLLKMVFFYEELAKTEKTKLNEDTINLIIFSVFDENKNLFSEGDELFEIIKTKE